MDLNMKYSVPFPVELLKSIGFEDGGNCWGDGCENYRTIWLGNGITIDVVSMRKVFLQCDNSYKELPEVNDISKLIIILKLLGSKSPIDFEVLQIYPGIYDIAPEREEI
ncbi:hypothetical protein ACR79M_08265 [Sphingobacterium spiritivorum]|uniref:hypothetical protein n=1 Tax=Sphingobacterium spiritivorum TaxID=258 RepID=UPI003DA4F480